MHSIDVVFFTFNTSEEIKDGDTRHKPAADRGGCDSFSRGQFFCLFFKTM